MTSLFDSAMTEEAPQATESAPAEGEFEDAKAEPQAPIGNQSASTDSSNNGVGGTPAQESSRYHTCITVEASYIGDLLDNYTPTPVSDHSEADLQELHYELTTAQYEDLLEALADRDELPIERKFHTDSDTVLVIVR